MLKWYSIYLLLSSGELFITSYWTYWVRSPTTYWSLLKIWSQSRDNTHFQDSWKASTKGAFSCFPECYHLSITWILNWSEFCVCCCFLYFHWTRKLLISEFFIYLFLKYFLFDQIVWYPLGFWLETQDWCYPKFVYFISWFESNITFGPYSYNTSCISLCCGCFISFFLGGVIGCFIA